MTEWRKPDTAQFMDVYICAFIFSPPQIPFPLNTALEEIKKLIKMICFSGFTIYMDVFEEHERLWFIP